MSVNRPFDLGKLDFEGIRLRRRRKLLLYSLPVCGLVLVITLKMLSIPVFSQVAHSSYRGTSYQAANNWLSPLGIINWFEPYKQPFDQGVAQYRLAEFVLAEQAFRAALITVPSEHECDVRINVALS